MRLVTLASMPMKRKGPSSRAASTKKRQRLKVSLSELLKGSSAAVTKQVLANYEGACQLMTFSVDDEDADQVDPVYTIVFSDAGLQARVNAGIWAMHSVQDRSGIKDKTPGQG